MIIMIIHCFLAQNILIAVLCVNKESTAFICMCCVHANVQIFASKAKYKYMYQNVLEKRATHIQ